MIEVKFEKYLHKTHTAGYELVKGTYWHVFVRSKAYKEVWVLRGAGFKTKKAARLWVIKTRLEGRL